MASPHLRVRRQQDLSQERLALKEKAKNQPEDFLIRKQFHDTDTTESLTKRFSCLMPSHKAQISVIEANRDITVMAEALQHQHMRNSGSLPTYRRMELAAYSIEQGKQATVQPRLNRLSVVMEERKSIGNSMATAPRACTIRNRDSSHSAGFMWAPQDEHALFQQSTCRSGES
ncbi:MAG: hypothetical protein ACOVNL_13065 [Prochlorococcaceae cyanobacterium]